MPCFLKFYQENPERHICFQESDLLLSVRRSHARLQRLLSDRHCLQWQIVILPSAHLYGIQKMYGEILFSRLPCRTDIPYLSRECFGLMREAVQYPARSPGGLPSSVWQALFLKLAFLSASKAE